jgi:hypothetical protein
MGGVAVVNKRKRLTLLQVGDSSVVSFGMTSQADGVRAFGGIPHSHAQIIVGCCVLLAIISFLGTVHHEVTASNSSLLGYTGFGQFGRLFL